MTNRKLCRSSRPSPDYADLGSKDKTLEIHKAIWSAAGKRWQLAGEPRPKAEWHSFDRTPWKHPWMSRDNIRQFAEFSKLQLAGVQDHVERAKSQRKQGRFAFVGNMANVNYIRALPLRRRGLNVDLIMHPQDDFPFAQPAWEEFDGEITELGDNPSKVFSEANCRTGRIVIAKQLTGRAFH